MDDFESCIDDRCPTIWGPSSRPRESPWQTQQEPLNYTKRQEVTSSQNLNRPTVDAVPDAPRVTAIDGNLLRRLYQATVDEKRRAAEKEKETRGSDRQSFEEAPRSSNDRTVSNGFYVMRTGSTGGKVKSSGERVKDSPPEARKKDKKDQKTKTKAPEEQPGVQTANNGAPLDAPSSEREDGEARDSAPELEEKPGKQKNKKQEKVQQQQNQPNKLSKKQKKQQNKAEDERAKAAAEAAQALMSGGIVGGQEAPVSEDNAGKWLAVDEVSQPRSQPDEPRETAPCSASKSKNAYLQPIVESASSSRHSRRLDTYARPPSARSPAEKAPSFVSWEEIGQGVIEEQAVRIASRIASQKSRSKTPSNHDFQEIDEVWGTLEPHEGVLDRHSSSSRSKLRSKRSSKSGVREKERLVSQYNPSRHFRASQRSREAADTFAEHNDAWVEQTGAESRSNASSSRTKAQSRSHIHETFNPWPEADAEEVAYIHFSSRQQSKAASHLTFEEVGEAFVHNTLKPETPRASNRSGRSKQPSNRHEELVDQSWLRPVSGKPAPGSSKPSSSKVFVEDGEGWLGANPQAPPSKAISIGLPEGDLQEIGEGWQEPHAQGVSVQRHVASVRSQKIYEKSTSSQLGELYHGVGPWQSHGWDGATEPRSGSSSAASTMLSCESSDAGTPLEHMGPTVFAGKGWISPHPLSRSPTELASPPQSKIVLPSQAHAHGKTMSYEEWKELQEEGIRRNISPTESHMTVGAKRAESRHRYVGWGAHSSDGYRFEEKSVEASISGPASCRPPSMDSERSEAMFSDERPPTNYTDRNHPSSHHGRIVRSWDGQELSEYSERSGRHSRVQTLSEWSHDHSGSKQAHDGSELSGSRGARDSNRSSSRHDSTHSRHHSSRQSSHRSSHKSSRQSGHLTSDHSGRRSVTTRSKQPSVGWGRFSLGSAVSLRSKHEITRNDSHHSSHREGGRKVSVHGNHRSESSWQQSSHRSAESKQNIHRSSAHHSSRQSDRHSVGAWSEEAPADWKQSSHGSVESQESGDRSSRGRSSRHTSQRSTSDHSLPRATTWRQVSQASLSTHEREMEVMEEGLNIWSDIPQYDGTVSDRDHGHEYPERSEVSHTPTSRLYLNRYPEYQESSPQWD